MPKAIKKYNVAFTHFDTTIYNKVNWKHFQIDIGIEIYCFSFRASAVAKTHVKKQIKEIYMYNNM